MLEFNQKGSVFRLTAKQTLNTTIEQAWAFLSDPNNLKEITPTHMGFDIISGADRPMFPGQIIQYKVSPFKGISTLWVTEITHVKDQAYFVDEQRFGPYKFWHHKHFLTETATGVLMEDIIDYKIPMRLLASTLNTIMVKPQLRKIFNYREAKLAERFV